MRQARGWDHAQLHALALPKPRIDDDSRRRAGSRWEAKSTVKDRATAVRLAEVLGTTVAALQGGAPEPAPDRVTEIAEQLARQLEAGNPHALAEMVGSSNEKRSIEAVSQTLAIRIELAQLTRQTASLRQLSEVTGWNAGELERPANLHGYWLIASEGEIDTGTSEIKVGVDEALWRLEQEVMTWLRIDEATRHPTICADARLIFEEEAPWFRIRLIHPTRPWASKTLSLVRCEPGESGMKWTKPTRYDRREIQRVLINFWSLSNFIEGFGVGPSPTDLRRLRLLVERLRLKMNRRAFEEGRPDPLPEIAAIVEGDLGELEDERLEAFRRDGAAHTTVVNRIAHGLWTALAEDLSRWPRDCWKLRPVQGAFTVELDTRPYVAFRLGRRLRAGPRYRISVVELLEDGRLCDQPWRRDSVAETMKLLEWYMGDLPEAPAVDQWIFGPPRPEDWPDPDD